MKGGIDEVKQSMRFVSDCTRAIIHTARAANIPRSPISWKSWIHLYITSFKSNQPNLITSHISHLLSLPLSSL